MPEKDKIKKLLSSLSHTPGVYKMLNEEGTVIYIGKAKNLSKRVKQYFQKDYQHSSRTKKLIEKISDIQTIGVDTELEATILEHNLIKQFQPKYNVIMKDDKNFVYIKITEEDFPRIQIVRKIEKDNAKYIGPKTASHKVKETLKILKKIFPFRHCGLNIKLINKNSPRDSKQTVKISNKTIKYPCLDYYIKRCSAPCIGNCTKEDYRKVIKNIENFLAGKAEEILSNLYQEMREAAKENKFEKAAKIRDKIKKAEAILEKQKVADGEGDQKDIINYCITQNRAYFNLFQIRDGKLIGQENFILNAKDAEESEGEEILESFLKQYYEIATDIPKEILIPHKTDNTNQLEEFINNQTKFKTKLTIPQKGIKNKLLEMSLNNARIFADRNKPSWKEESPLTENATKKLGEILRIKNIKRIECYDISHLSGTNTVGSMIVFEKGIPKKDMYRKFQIKTAQGSSDDYKSMEEVLYRRFLKIALEAKFKEYKFKKARKKDFDFIKQNNKIPPEKKDREFYIIENKKGPQGFIAIKEHTIKVTELKSLWIKKEKRGEKLGHLLLKKVLEKTKNKRVYAICKPGLKEYYLLAGFEEIKTIPKELKKEKNKCYLVYDKTKHKPDKSFSKIPDLVVVDGGKGQLSSVNKIFEQLGVCIPRIALAKKLEEIYIPTKTSPIQLPQNNEALKLLQRARDEAHRFAISYQRNLNLKSKFR